MSDHVNALAPVVERALDARGVREALGSQRDPEPEPRADGGRTGWGAARHAADRVD
jgi:hypothetical protein